MARLLLAGMLAKALGAIPPSWHGRSIYFVVTDRFAADSDNQTTQCHGSGWCGGTFKGVQNKLDYIQGMGFDAVWVTPVVKQVDWLDTTGGTGFHGYWAGDFNKIDPHLGTEADLLELSRECRCRGMSLMVDVVANHVGPLDTMEQVQQLAPPFNGRDGASFHQAGRQASEGFDAYLRHPLNAFSTGCTPGNYTCDGYNETIFEQGWFYDLGDLRQEHEGTRNFLLTWVRDLVRRYELDGLRLDTALYMPQWFLSEFQQSAGVYIIGEVTTQNFSYHRSFQGPLQGLLNFPVTEHLGSIFQPNGSLWELQGLLKEQRQGGYADEHLLGNFVDNHDGPRFLPTHHGDVVLLENALTWTLLHHGIPIVYYGTEQMDVSMHDDNRASMWPYFAKNDMYLTLQRLNRLRKEYGFSFKGSASTAWAHTVLARQDVLVFVRGELLVAVTNVGSNPSRPPRACVPLASLPIRWSSVCSGQPGNSAAARHVLRDGSPPPRCEDGRICVDLDEGRPVVVAAFEVERFI